MNDAPAGGGRPEPSHGHGPARSGRGEARGGGRSAGRDGGQGPTDRPRRDGRPARPASERSRQAPSERNKHADAARTAAYDTLRAVAESDAYANLVLPPMLRSRGIVGRDAGFATELAYGTLRRRGFYDRVLTLASGRDVDALDDDLRDVLRLGTHQVLAMRVPAHAAVSQTVALTRDRIGVGAGQLVNAVLRRVAEHDVETWTVRVAEAVDPEGTDPVARLAAEHSHPEWIVRALREALVTAGRDRAELADLLAADNVPPRVTLVARPGLAEPGELDGEPGRWAPTAVALEQGDPGALPAVRDGRAGVQDEGSQLVALTLAAAPLEGRDERWLDLCAGPGGKAALLAALAARCGARLVANEVAPHRVELVRQALRAVPGEAVEQVREGDGREAGDLEPAAYDRVMVDAPCTGLGALRRRPESRWRRTPSDLGPLGRLQRELLVSALRAVRPGGLVAYVTCSPHPAETGLVVRDALRTAERAGLAAEVVDAAAVLRGLAPGIELPDRPDVQLWPHVHGTDAMHLTLLRRTD